MNMYRTCASARAIDTSETEILPVSTRTRTSYSILDIIRSSDPNNYLELIYGAERTNSQISSFENHIHPMDLA